MKHLKAIIISLVILLIVVFNIVLVNIKYADKEIKKMKDAVRITYLEKDIDINNKDELITIIERSSKDSDFFINLSTNQEVNDIIFYNKNNKVITKVSFFPEYNYLAFKDKIERELLKKDIDRFYNIIGEIKEDNA